MSELPAAAAATATTGPEGANEKPTQSTSTSSEKITPPLYDDSLEAEIAEIKEREAKTGKKYIPFELPLPECKPVPPLVLTEDQAAKYNEVLKYCEAITTLPVSTEKAAESHPLSEDERMWLTKECLLRYLRAAKWDVATAQKRVEATLIWRRSYGVDTRKSEDVEIENETGKQWIMGYDNNLRPCHHLNPGRQNTDASPRQIQHLVWMLERSIDLMQPGCETLSLLIDFAKATSSKSPSVSTGRETLYVLQNHYPERLGKALCINLPWFIRGFFTLINPFIDPATREKIAFNEDMSKYIPKAQLETRFGGTVEVEYDHKVYWPILNKMCSKRRAEMKKRWIALGSKIGESELLLRGGSEEANLSAGIADLKV